MILDDYSVLLVEDDTNLGLILKQYLETKDYKIILCQDGQEGLNTYHRLKDEIDICILDVMLPKIDGVTLLEHIRKSDENVPVIFLTAKAQKEDIIQVFQAGADDYITKPFSMEELVARMKAVLRRAGHGAQEEEKHIFELGRFTFDSQVQTLKFGGNGEVKRLTSKENGLLKLLCQNRNTVLRRSYALKKVWLDDDCFNCRSMDVYITKIRKYLKEDPNVRIMNVHGEGFKLVEVESKD